MTGIHILSSLDEFAYHLARCEMHVCGRAIRSFDGVGLGFIVPVGAGGTKYSKDTAELVAVDHLFEVSRNVGKLCDYGTLRLTCGNIPTCWYPHLGRPLHRRRSQMRANRGHGGAHPRGRNTKGGIMTISKERKAELTAQYGKNAQDTGNSKVQVAILTERIKELTEHMKSHKKDFHTRRGLLMLVGKRRRLLSYIKKNDINEYRALIAQLGIRDNIQ